MTLSMHSWTMPMAEIKRIEPSAAPPLRVFQAVSDQLVQRIRTGDWLPGERLPSIAQLARDLGASTGSVREALRSMESAGMVRIEHGRGVFVSGERSSPQLADHFQDDTRGIFVALAEARRLLEPELAALAAERGTDAELLEIERLARATEQEARAGSAFVEADILLHRTIALAAHNPILERMTDGFGELLRQSRRRVAMEPPLTKRTVRYHLLIAEAIGERNAGQARLLMLAHMNDMVDSVLAIEARAASDGRA
jgi:GntR family transcriptional regulator, transcriptional repressor for pyruvate dehydrogenase complex